MHIYGVKIIENITLLQKFKPKHKKNLPNNLTEYKLQDLY